MAPPASDPLMSENEYLLTKYPKNPEKDRGSILQIYDIIKLKELLGK